jgi:tetratricopeptide (TPR) repeat protein
MWNSSDEAGMSSPSSTPSGAKGSFWRSPALWLAMVLLIVAATYLQAPRIGFIWDDHLLIEGQASRPLSDVISTPYWRRADLGLATGAYHRPVTELTWALDRAVYGAGPAGFHVTNVLIHLIVCALLFFLCRAAGAPPPHAAFAAAIFGVTPRLLESIGCASGRTDPLATLACLAALLAWGRGGAPPARRALAALLLFAGLLAKEVAIAGVLAIAALELARVRRGETTPRDALQDITPVAVAMMLWLALRSAALTGAAVASTGFSIGDRVLFVPQALGRYVLMLLSPFEPTLRIGRLGVIDGFEVAIGAATIAGVAALAVRAWRDRWSPPLIAAATLGGLSIAPVLHFFAPLQEVVASDRYLYLPLAALLWALTPGIARALEAGRPARLRGALAFAAAGLVLALAWTTANTIELWRDEPSLWQATARDAHPLDSLPHTTLGGLAGQRGQPEAAILHFERAAQIDAAYAQRVGIAAGDPQRDGALALALSELGRGDEALATIRRGLRDHPGVPILQRDLGLVRARRLEFAAAEAALAEAERLHPGIDPGGSLLARIREAAALWRSLPEPRTDEPIRIRAMRARVLAQVGQMAGAAALFAEVARAPSASPEDVRLAALFLVHRGSIEAADEALSRLEGLGPAHASDIAGLRQTLSSRRAASAPAA